MYSASLGRFLSRDPAGYIDGMNLYAYARNNPIMLFDPWGLEGESSDPLNRNHLKIAILTGPDPDKTSRSENYAYGLKTEYEQKINRIINSETTSQGVVEALSNVQIRVGTNVTTGFVQNVESQAEITVLWTHGEPKDANNSPVRITDKDLDQTRMLLNNVEDGGWTKISDIFKNRPSGYIYLYSCFPAFHDIPDSYKDKIFSQINSKTPVTSMAIYQSIKNNLDKDLNEYIKNHLKNKQNMTKERI